MKNRKIMVERQPVIPDMVQDYTIKREWHLGKDYWVFSIRSEGDGLREWTERRMREWNMPEELLQKYKPDGVEYYREICPFVEGVLLDGEKIVEVALEEENDVWYWKLLVDEDWF